jgi:hypothetical protein
MVKPTDKQKPYEEFIAAAAPMPTAPATPPKVIYNKKKRYVVKPGQYRAGCWVHSPGMLVLFKATDAALVDNAEERGISTNQVLKIRAAKLDNEKKVYIFATEDDDEDGLDLKRSNGKITCNLVSFLAENRLCVETGYKERYEIVEAGADSPVGPALVFDMSKPAERALLPIRSQPKRSTPPTPPPAPAPESDTTGDE